LGGLLPPVFGPGVTPFAAYTRENPVSTNEIAFLVLALSAFSLFGGVLAWASRMESRSGSRK